MDMEFGRAYCPDCDGEGVTYSDWHRVEGEAGEQVCKKCGGNGWVRPPSSSSVRRIG